MNRPDLAHLAGDPSLDLTWLGPVLLFVGGVIVAVINGIAQVYKKRSDKKEVADQAAATASVGKQLSEKEEIDAVAEARAQATKFYNYYVTFRTLFYQVQEGLRHLVRNLGLAHPDMELDKDVIDALALKAPDVDPK